MACWFLRGISIGYDDQRNDWGRYPRRYYFIMDDSLAPMEDPKTCFQTLGNFTFLNHYRPLAYFSQS